MSDVMAHLVDRKQRERLQRRFGSGAEDWLAELPAVIEKLAAEWQVSVDGPAPHGRTSVVVHCTRDDGAPAIMKLSPDVGLVLSEARILRLWEATRRVPRVWAVDPDRGALLMEAIGDGRTIAFGGVVPPMETIGSLISELHGIDISRHELMEMRPLSTRVQYVFDVWGYERAAGPAADVVPATLLHSGYARARDLSHGRESNVPLHGDLHPGNVLDGGPGRGLVAVDPRACVGDAAADAVDWPLWKATSLEEVERRALVLAAAIDVPSERLIQWCRAFAPCFATAMANRGRADTAEFEVLLALAEGERRPPRGGTATA